MKTVHKIKFNFQKSEIRPFGFGSISEKTEISDEKYFHLWVSKNMKILDYMTPGGMVPGFFTIFEDRYQNN